MHHSLVLVESPRGVRKPGQGLLYCMTSVCTSLIKHCSFSGCRSASRASLYHQRGNGDEWGDADSMTFLLQYKGPIFTLKATVVNMEEEQLSFCLRGTNGTHKKKLFSRVYSTQFQIVYNINYSISVNLLNSNSNY